MNKHAPEVDRSMKHKAAGYPVAPSWHELVQPGPKGSEKRRQERIDRAHVGVIVFQAGSGAPRAQRREAGNRRHDAGRLVLHPRRARSGGGIDRTNVTAAATANRAARIAALADKQAAA